METMVGTDRRDDAWTFLVASAVNLISLISRPSYNENDGGLRPASDLLMKLVDHATIKRKRNK